MAGSSSGSGRGGGTYNRDGSLPDQVVDIPMGGGVDEKEQKQLFEPPFLAEAKNVEVNKTGSTQKRAGIQAIIPAAVPSAAIHPMAGTGTLFQHPGGQLGVVGQPDFNYTSSSSGASLSVVANNDDFNTSYYVESNKTGIYSCGIEEDPAVRVDEALLHVQSSISGDKVITVWCSAFNPITTDECYDIYREVDNRCYYMVKERSTGTVLTPPTRLHDIVAEGFTQNPRYTHIALVDHLDPHWVIVAAPELHQDNTKNYLTAASISVTTGARSYSRLGFVDGQTVSTFTAFDMHAGSGSQYAHIIAQAATASGHSDYIFRIDKTLVVSLFKALATNEVPEHCGAIYHDASLGKVFTAVSNQDGIAGALPGDGETWVHGYNDSLYGVLPGYPLKAFAQVVPTAWPSYEVGITGACTRLSICEGSPSGLYVFGTQFWNPLGYATYDMTWLGGDYYLDKAVSASECVGSKSMLNTRWTEVKDAFTVAPSLGGVNDQASCYITTKGFKGTSATFPMIGLAVTNGAPVTAYPLESLSETSEAKYKVRYPPDPPVGPAAATTEPSAGNCPEDQASKHPMAVVAIPMVEEGFLRPIARFGSDMITEAEDVFPFECGVTSNEAGDLNAVARWMSPGLSEVHSTEVSGEHLFVYRSRLLSGVARLPEYNRLKLTTLDSATFGGTAQGVMFSTNAGGAFGGEEVRLNLADTRLSVTKDAAQTYFSGGYLGLFDGVDNGESDVHSSPGRPFVQLYSSAIGAGARDWTRPPNTVVSGRFWGHYKVTYTFVLVYALYDEDGMVHRSAPSPERVVSHYIEWPTGGNLYEGAVALRYLMPPPSAFMLPNQDARAKKLIIEVYAKAANTIEKVNGSADRPGLNLDVTSFTLIDSFEPETAPLQQKFYDYTAGIPAIQIYGSCTTPWTAKQKEDGYVRSGFKFFGERHIYKPRYYLEDSLTDKNNNISDGEFSNTVLYTSGGVLDNDPPPAFSCIHSANRRMWGIPANNRSSVWYSKLLAPGAPPEWSAAFTITTPRSDDTLTAISSMDEKVVLFSRQAVFILRGEGPNNLGRGSAIIGPQKVAVGIGCVNRSSVVTGPFGIMFQSEEGIYILGRDLNVTFVGAKVEDELTGDNDISSAVLVEEKQQVRFTLDASGQTQLKVLCFDYYHGVWTVFTSASSTVRNTTSSAMINSRHTFLGSDNYINRDVPGSYYDGTAALQEPVVSEFTTAWIKLAGVQGFQRVKRAYFLGEHTGGPVSLSAQYNYNESVSTTETWLDNEFVSGGGTLPDDPMQVGIHIPRQKCQSIRFKFVDDAQNTVSGGSLFSMISLLVGRKQGLYKTSPGSKK